MGVEQLPLLGPARATTKNNFHQLSDMTSDMTEGEGALTRLHMGGKAPGATTHVVYGKNHVMRAARGSSLFKAVELFVHPPFALSLAAVGTSNTSDVAEC